MNKIFLEAELFCKVAHKCIIQLFCSDYDLSLEKEFQTTLLKPEGLTEAYIVFTQVFFYSPFYLN